MPYFTLGSWNELCAKPNRTEQTISSLGTVVYSPGRGEKTDDDCRKNVRGREKKKHPLLKCLINNVPLVVDSPGVAAAAAVSVVVPASTVI